MYVDSKGLPVPVFWYQYECNFKYGESWVPQYKSHIVNKFAIYKIVVDLSFFRYLDNNRLTGSIPPELGNMTLLNYLYARPHDACRFEKHS